MSHTLFTDFPGIKEKLSYSEAETRLSTVFTLLKDEYIDFFYPIKIRSSGYLSLFGTNWAIRGIFDKPITQNSIIHNFVIPLKTIIKLEKKGGQKMRKEKYGIKFYLSTGGYVTFPFPMDGKVRTIFINRVNTLKQNVLHFDEELWKPDPTWVLRLTEISQYDIIKNDFCDTYPPYILIPRDAKKSLVEECSKYRSRQRVPVLSYMFITSENEKIPLLRSSQPLTGIANSESKYDQQYLEYFCSSHNLIILDCRPKINAVANQFTGGGYESTNHYKKVLSQVTFRFLGIPNIHKVRECYIEMMKGVFKGDKHSYQHWGELTMQLLEGASIAVDSLINKHTVLVHCTDGWDRTAQICALSQIMLDDYCRTIKGFVEVIQREWIDSGHMFAVRCSHETNEKMNEVSPIFAQFIDSVSQLIKKFPNAFEFNLHFLEFILANAYAQLFGDFLGTNYNNRVQMKRPTSLFLCLDDKKYGIIDKIKNDQYQETNEIIKLNKSEKYVYHGELLGTPVFFSEGVPELTGDPPPIPSYSLDEIERVTEVMQIDRDRGSERIPFSRDQSYVESVYQGDSLISQNENVNIGNNEMKNTSNSHTDNDDDDDNEPNNKNSSNDQNHTQRKKPKENDNDDDDDDSKDNSGTYSYEYDYSEN